MYQRVYSRCAFLPAAAGSHVIETPDPSDIVPGVLGNCVLQSVLNFLTGHPSLLMDIFLTKKMPKDNRFRLRLFKGAEPLAVTVSGCFPCFLGKSLFLKAGNSIWGVLIEKA